MKFLQHHTLANGPAIPMTMLLALCERFCQVLALFFPAQLEVMLATLMVDPLGISSRMKHETHYECTPMEEAAACKTHRQCNLALCRARNI
jgi:hypothetical protein